MPLTFLVIPGKVFGADETVTIAKLNQLGAPTIQVLDDDITFIVADGSITTVKLADGVLSADVAGWAKMADEYVTAAKLAAALNLTGKTLTGNPTVTWTGAINFSGAVFTPPAGHLIQQVYNAVTTASTLSSTIPFDDTIPQNTEGSEVLTQTITPKSATSILEIQVEIPYYVSSTITAQVVALFQDSTANALAATWAAVGSNEGYNVLRLTHRMVSGTTSATTFKVRVGTSGGTVTINGQAGSRLLGGVMAARLFIKEISA